MDKTVLRDLGLTNNEVDIYITLLSAGSISVNAIAERSALHRQAVYDALDRLLEKGFVSFVIKNNKKHFQAVHPDRILDFLKEREEKLRIVLPDLIRLTTIPEEDTSVEVFKGKGVVRTLYRDVLKTLKAQPGEVLISGVEEDKFIEEDRIALSQYLVRLQRLSSSERVLVRETDSSFVEGPQTTYRSIPDEYFNPIPIYVYGNRLANVIWGHPNFAIVIKNKSLAETYRRQFNMLWSIAKTVNHK
ncbi:MAG: helix-turn-helix domain-containing protein [archaeon]